MSSLSLMTSREEVSTTNFPQLFVLSVRCPRTHKKNPAADLVLVQLHPTCFKPFSDKGGCPSQRDAEGRASAGASRTGLLSEPHGLTEVNSGIPPHLLLASSSRVNKL